jgi:excisionase family DNA binding protein
MTNTERRLLTIAEFAQTYAVSRGTVYKLAKTGSLRLSKVLGKTVIRTEDAVAWERSLRRIGEGA